MNRVRTESRRQRSPDMPGEVSVALYRGLTGALTPAIPMLLSNRVKRGKEDALRLAERRGFPSVPRPPGTLIWIHAASVGESLAALPLAPRLLEKPERSVLFTTGTVTSAELMRERLPANAIHQYAPLDLPAGVSRFLTHWRPELALFVESELWPNLLLEARWRKIPLVLINARLSERSFTGWSRFPGMAQRVFSTFHTCLAQDGEVAQRLSALGAGDVRVCGNLKADAPPLPVDEGALAAFRAALQDRPVFLAASTHPGEDESLLDAVAEVKHSGALTIIVPRHPGRGGDIEKLAVSRGFRTARRSDAALPDSQTQVYVADTMGELGLFYRLARLAFLGGSLIPHGGQNPLEPARLCVPVIAGPHTDNFNDIYRLLFAAQGMGRIESAGEISVTIQRFLASPAEAQRIGAQGRKAVDGLGGALNLTLETAERLLANARA